MKSLVGAAATDVGLKRDNNEDSYFFDDALGLYLVADGMGGAASGEVASGMVADGIAGYFKKYAGRPLEDPERYDFYDASHTDRVNTLLQAVHLANGLVYEASHRNDEHQGMGSTLAVFMTDGEEMVVLNVGDSRVFRSREGLLERLTIDHRMADDPKFKGLINPEATIMSRLGNTLTRAMGVRENVDPDVHRLPLEDGDVFLACSDGLSDMVDEEMISKVMAMERPLAQKAKDLIELALAGGGRDNVTVLLAETSSPGVIRGLFSRLAKNK